MIKTFIFSTMILFGGVFVHGVENEPQFVYFGKKARTLIY